MKTEYGGRTESMKKLYKNLRNKKGLEIITEDDKDAKKKTECGGKREIMEETNKREMRVRRGKKEVMNQRRKRLSCEKENGSL